MAGVSGQEGRGEGGGKAGKKIYGTWFEVPGLRSISLDHIGLCLENVAHGKHRKPISQVRKDYWVITLILLSARRASSFGVLEGFSRGKKLEFRFGKQNINL